MAYSSLDGISPTICDHGPAFVAQNAEIIGKIILNEDSNIWYYSVLRGDNEPITIGRRTNIQEHSVLHTDMGYPLTVGDDCTIGHRAILHGCTIGNNSLIGMGAIVLNGAKIGANSLVGAGALVTEGKIFPENSLIVGSPARVVKTLDENAIDQINASAAHYVQNAKRFAAGLKSL
ncbi:MAG: gamma carbonic anhydrase family protein [Pseudomonadota bacterium]